MNEPKHIPGYPVRGRVAGVYVTTGARWSDALGEWMYEAFLVDRDGRKLGPLHNVPESALQERPNWRTT